MNHSAPKILYTASSSAHLVSFHLPYLAALRLLGWDVTAAANGSGERLGEGVRFLAVPFTKSFVSPKNFRAAALLARVTISSASRDILCPLRPGFAEKCLKTRSLSA